MVNNAIWFWALAEHLELFVISKCMPVLMYGLEVCPLQVSDKNSLDFVVNHFFMELFKTNNNDTVDCCRMHFQFDLPSILAQRRTMNFVPNTVRAIIFV